MNRKFVTAGIAAALAVPLALAAALPTAAPAVAQERPQPPAARPGGPDMDRMMEQMRQQMQRVLPGMADRDGRGALQLGGAGGVPNVMQFDTNGDGAVTQAEVDAMRTDRLKQFDKNADGKLSLEEYQALWLDAYRTQMVRAFQGHDADGDAAVTIEEFNREYANIVRRADRNGDGKVDQADTIRQQAQNAQPQQGQPPQQPQRRVVPAPQQNQRGRGI